MVQRESRSTGNPFLKEEGKKMKSLLRSIAVIVVLLAVSSASAGTLYWQVTSETGATFDEAWLVATKEGEDAVYLDNRQSDGGSPSSAALTQTDISGYESWSFYVEMCNYNSTDDSYTPVATGNTYTYDQLMSNGYVATGATDANTAMAAAAGFNMGAGGAIPEPSSGLLLLIGGAMLALRRRRQK